MSLFKTLPDLYYKIQTSPVDVKLFAAKNIWRRSEIVAEFKNSVTIFDEMIVNNGAVSYTHLTLPTIYSV